MDVKYFSVKHRDVKCVLSLACPQSRCLCMPFMHAAYVRECTTKSTLPALAWTCNHLTIEMSERSEHGRNRHMLMIADDCLSFHPPQTVVFERGKLRPRSQAHSAKACG